MLGYIFVEKQFLIPLKHKNMYMESLRKATAELRPPPGLESRDPVDRPRGCKGLTEDGSTGRGTNTRLPECL